MSNIVKYGDWTPEQIEKESKELQTNSDFWKPPVGRTAIRFLPPKIGWPSPFVIQHQHFIRLPGKDKPIVFCCPRLHEKKQCLACAKADQLESSGNGRDAQIAKGLRPQKRILANVVVGHGSGENPEEAGVSIYAFGASVYNSLKAIREDAENGGNFLHPETGFNIVIKRVGTGKDDTRYTIMPSRQATKLANMDWIDMQPDLRKMVRVPTTDQQERLLAGEDPKDVWGDDSAAAPKRASSNKGRGKKDDVIDVDAAESTAEDDLFDDELDLD